VAVREERHIVRDFLLSIGPPSDELILLLLVAVVLAAALPFFFLLVLGGRGLGARKATVPRKAE